MDILDIAFNFNSFLSPPVLELLHASVTMSSENMLISDTFLDWEKLHDMSDFSDYSKHCFSYKDAVTKLSPLINNIFRLFLELPIQEFEKDYTKYLKWTNNEKLFMRAFELLKSTAADCILAMQLLTAGLERALGDAYLLKGEKVPYMFKDLLSTNELQDIFGAIPIGLLNVVMGTPASLNLRNIVWHGFVSPHEFDQRYGYFLIVLTMSLGLKVENLIIQHRPFLTFDKCYLLNGTFSDIHLNEDIEKLSNAFKNTLLIPNFMKTLWVSSLEKFQEERFGEALTILIPQLENCLRMIFAIANKSPKRILTAEPDARYVTLTEIFNEFLDDGSLKNFKTFVTTQQMELLFDIFVHPEGPRVRDRLSHGEVDFFKIPKTLVSHIFHVAELLCGNFKDKDESTDEFVLKLEKFSSNYESLFHSTSFLKRNVFSLIVSLTLWDSCPSIPSEDDAETKHCLDAAYNFTQVASFQYVLGPSTTRWSSFSDGLEVYDSLITNQVISTFHRPKCESEVTALLRKITSHSISSSDNIIHALKNFYSLSIQKSLRSRQRDTYSRLLKSVKSLYCGLRSVLIFIIAMITHINVISDFADDTLKTILKFMKLSLKYVENLNVMTSSNVNKWGEASNYTYEFLLNIGKDMQALNNSLSTKSTVMLDS